MIGWKGEVVRRLGRRTLAEEEAGDDVMCRCVLPEETSNLEVGMGDGEMWPFTVAAEDEVEEEEGSASRARSDFLQKCL
jgi:hypothetical protein